MKISPFLIICSYMFFTVKSFCQSLPKSSSNQKDSLKQIDNIRKDAYFSFLDETKGIGNFLIDSTTADSMIHNFDVSFRNRKEYDNSPSHRPMRNSRTPHSQNPHSRIPAGVLTYGRRDDVANRYGWANISKSVWFDKYALHYLDSILQTADSITGARIYLASYMKGRKVPSQYYTEQSTVVIVPTTLDSTSINKPGKSMHKDNFGVLKKEYEKYKNLLALHNKQMIDYALNHGELCPDNCPVIDDDASKSKIKK